MVSLVKIEIQVMLLVQGTALDLPCILISIL